MTRLEIMRTPMGRNFFLLTFSYLILSYLCISIKAFLGHDQILTLF